ncbi:uncharacterized protein LOC142203932 [Leptodactylus fuscus]|uniref:uncharacterized protein LOC142203932 n=1 Tax=Leptodactylus fuscus TaxID=238119 RepID=UPI003F4F2E4A
MERHSAEFITDFIDMYRSFTCLWKVKSPDYCNRQKKAKAFEKLIEVSRKYYPTADLRFVKHKIQNLRTVYKKELNKVEASKRSGTDPVYTPRLWYFDMLAFTKDQEVSQTSPEAEDEAPSASCENYEAIKLYVKEETEETDTSPSTVPSESSPTINAVPYLSPGRSRKRSREQMNKTNDLLQQAKQLLGSSADEFEGIALNVAGKLRRMSERQRLYCEKLITDLLIKGLLGELDEDTIIHNRRHVGPLMQSSVCNNY